MSEAYSKDFDEIEEMMRYVLRDPDTDEITGIDPLAPRHVKERFKRYMAELDSLEPVER